MQNFVAFSEYMNFTTALGQLFCVTDVKGKAFNAIIRDSSARIVLIPLIFFIYLGNVLCVLQKKISFNVQISNAASGWAGWALAHPEFGSSVNPITTRGADYAHHITASPPGFENPAASL